jgi:glutamate formiminotransferase
MGLFELVPNLSEGRRDEVVTEAVRAVEATGARVLHRTSDPVHHRSVLTIAGDERSVLDAAVALAEIAVRHIDLRVHRGEHPRMGALDVLPFVPLRDATMDQAVALAHEAGRRIWERLRVPCHFYGEAARSPERRSLAVVRRGGFEALAERFADPAQRPDVGDVPAHPTAGATAIGARKILIAFNVELATGEIEIARSIARTLRERDGGLRTLRAMAFRLADDRVQVSFNVTDHRATPLPRIMEAVRLLAAERGVAVLRGELIGMAPLAALEPAAFAYLRAVPAWPSP